MLPRSATAGDRVSARVFDSATRRKGARLDAYRVDDMFYIDIDLPGADTDHLACKLENGMLTLSIPVAGEHH